MKKFRKPFVVAVSFALIAGAIAAPAGAAKKKKPKPPPAPVAVDLKFFLASNGCPPQGSTAKDAEDFLTLTDTEDAIECNHTSAGIRNDVQTMTPAYTRDGQSRWWDTIDGVPVVLDVTKHITGEIFTSGTQCAAAGACSPSPLSAGSTTLDIRVFGVTGGEEVEIGTFTETYDVPPGTVHTVKVDVPIDAAHAGKVFESITMVTFQHGNSAGHGVIKSNAPTSSYIVLPTIK